MKTLKMHELPETAFAGCLYCGHRGIFVNCQGATGWCLLLNDNGQQSILPADRADMELKTAVIHYRQNYQRMTIVIEFRTLEEQFQWFAAGE